MDHVSFYEMKAEFWTGTKTSFEIKTSKGRLAALRLASLRLSGMIDFDEEENLKSLQIVSEHRVDL